MVSREEERRLWRGSRESRGEKKVGEGVVWESKGGVKFKDHK